MWTTCVLNVCSCQLFLCAQSSSWGWCKINRNNLSNIFTEHRKSLNDENRFTKKPINKVYIRPSLVFIPLLQHKQTLKFLNVEEWGNKLQMRMFPGYKSKQQCQHIFNPFEKQKVIGCTHQDLHLLQHLQHGHCDIWAVRAAAIHQDHVNLLKLDYLKTLFCVSLWFNRYL